MPTKSRSPSAYREDDLELRDLSGRSTPSFSRESEESALSIEDPLHRQPSELTDDDESVETFRLYTPDEENNVRRKIDRRVVTLVSLLYLLSFLDRSNIGNAKIAGLMRDLRLSDAQFEWLLTAFYITYIAFEWMILLYQVLRPHIYISICVFSWGLLASLQSVTTNFSSMLVLRAMLGVSEAAFGPGVPFYLSFFYRRDELALRTGLQLSAAPLASAFAGTLAYVIARLGQNGLLAPWRLLFLVEGFPSVIVAVFAWRMIPDSPETAAFLSPREQKVARLRLREGRQRHQAPQEKSLSSGIGPSKLDFAKVWRAIRDPKCYLTAFMFLNCNIAFASMPVFLPTVLHDMGYSSLSAQALSAPPFLLAFVVLLVTARLSDRMSARSPFVILHSLVAFGGYATIAVGGMYEWPPFVRYMAIYPACAGFFSAICIIVTWTLNNQQSREGRGAGMTILNVVGQCGPLIGTRLYPDSDKPYYVRGMTVCACAMLIVCGLAILLRRTLVAENAKQAGFFELAHDLDEGSEGRDDSFIDPEREELDHERFIMIL